jgi:hypothetical protein
MKNIRGIWFGILQYDISIGQHFSSWKVVIVTMLEELLHHFVSASRVLAF